jgi:eukaryotic-like serine/threonine-protein kinase
MLMAHTDHSLGDVVGRYRLLGEMARGGMGIVYLAAAQGPAGFSKLVALKELRPDLVEDEEFLTMFLEEARMAARLNHPNIVQTNDVDESHGRHFIAMEYLEGRSLYHVVKRFAKNGGFPQRMALSVLRDVLAALDYAHELAGFDGKPLGFVHRDVSPHNIFITFEGHTKVIDFGIAKARDSSLETKTGVLKGRANYMAPEQLTRHADRRSDIFSVGAVLFEVLSGRRLWQGMGEIEILAALTRGEIPSLHAVRPDTPATLVQICQQALAAHVDDRFSTAAEMRDALDQHLWATGGAPRHRDVSDALLREFDTERQRTRATIEAALFRLQAGESGRLEALDFRDPRDSIHDSRRGSNSPVSGFAGERRHTASSLHTSSRVQHTPSRVQHTPSALTGLPGVSLSSVVRAGAALPPSTHELLEPLDPPSLLTRIWRGQPWLVGTAFAAVFIATTMAVALHRAPPQAPEPITPAPAAVAVPVPMAMPRPAAPETIVFSVSVTPSTAQISIDGQPMPSNPFVGHFVKANGTHRVRATAPGHQPKERLVSFDDNVMIDLSLTQQPQPPPQPPQPAHVTTSNERAPQRRWEPARHYDAPARHEAQPPQHAPASLATPSLAPAPVAEKPRRDPNDIVPRGEWEPPRKRTIDTSNPYGDDK